MEILTNNLKFTYYDQVNKTETLDELAKVVDSLKDDQGMIQGRTRKFRVENMVYTLKAMEKNESYKLEVLTRNWGIRQQALMLLKQKEGVYA